MLELPHNWVNAQIGDLIELNPKNSVATDETIAGFVPMQMVGTAFRSKVDFEQRPWHEIKKGYTHFQNGDVLLAKITPCFENGKAGFVNNLPNGIGAGSTEYFVCRVKPAVLNPHYLLAFMKTPQFVRNGAMQMTGSVGHKRVPKDYLIETELPLAPLIEQKRIAAKLDVLLMQVDACRNRLDKIPGIIKRFRQAVLSAATAGQLTEGWQTTTNNRADPMEIAPHWQNIRLGGIAIDLRYGTSKKCDYATVGIGVLRIPNIADHGLINNEDLKYAEFTADEVEKLSLKQGDLLVIRSNGSVDLVGKTSIVTKKESGLIFAGYLIRIRVDEKRANPAFIHLCLSDPEQRQRIQLTSKSTSGVNNINADELRNLPIVLPPLAEQAEIVRRVETLFAFADRLEARYTTARAQVENLTPALLAKAFRGELVPQDPNDEPASVLLARIQAQRAAPAQEKVKKTRASKA